MIIKSPIVYDISHYKEVADFSKIVPRPFLIITKATEGSYFVDNKFVRFFNGMKQADIHRGCYHFNRKSVNPAIQANHFINTIKAQITNDDVLVLDVEEGGESASALMEFIQIVKGVYPKNPFLIYSRKNILDPIAMTSSQREFFKSIPIWTAGYPFNPDTYPTPPAGYIPDRAKYGPVWLWQYTSSAIIGGIQGSVDLNWIHPDLYAIINTGGQVEPPPPTPGDLNMTETFPNGVKITTGREYNSDYETIIIPPTAISSATLNYNGSCKKGQVLDGDVIFNWSPFWACNDVNTGLKIDGKEVAPYNTNSFAPWISWDSNGVLVIEFNANLWKNRSTAGQGFRYIIQDGVKNPRWNFSNSSIVAWSETHPRTFVGKLYDGSTVIVVVRGRDSLNKGWTLHEGAAFGLLLGLRQMVDGDGGASSQVVVKYSDAPINVFWGVNSENRSVPVFGVIKLKQKLSTGVIVEPPPPPPPPPVGDDIFYSFVGDITIVLKDSSGNIIQTSKNDNEVRWGKV